MIFYSDNNNVRKLFRMRFALLAFIVLKYISPASGFPRHHLRLPHSSRIASKATERNNGIERVLWGAQLPLPFLPNGLDGIGGASSSLRLIYLLPVSTALVTQDWSYAATSSMLLALAVRVDAPQWTALVGGALVVGSLGNNQIVTNGMQHHATPHSSFLL